MLKIYWLKVRDLKVVANHLVPVPACKLVDVACTCFYMIPVLITSALLVINSKCKSDG
jgi:hypothetical protein